MPSKLGRGLDALLSKTFTVKNLSEEFPVAKKNENAIVEIEVDKIKSNPHQPRKNFNGLQIEELAQSIRQYGILQPLLVTIGPMGTYELLVGERRLMAAKLIGLKTVPVIMRSAQEIQKLEIALIENIQRHNLNPIEEARGFARLVEEFGLTQEQVAKKVGKSRSEIANTLRILSLPEEIKRAIFEERITRGHAKAILGLEDGKEQLKMLNQILNNRMPVRRVEEEVRKVRVAGHFRGKTKSPEILQMENRMRDVLGTRISVKMRGKKGYILIDFYSPEELNSIVEKISGVE